MGNIYSQEVKEVISHIHVRRRIHVRKRIHGKYIG